MYSVGHRGSIKVNVNYFFLLILSHFFYCMYIYIYIYIYLIVYRFFYLSLQFFSLINFYVFIWCPQLALLAKDLNT